MLTQAILRSRWNVFQGTDQKIRKICITPHKFWFPTVYTMMDHLSNSTPDLFAPATPSSPTFPEADYDLLVSFDGAMEPRNRPTAQGSWGYVVVDSAGKELQRECGLIPLGECKSNNVAEYTALLKALEWVKANAVGRNVLFQGDSKLVVEHCRETWGWNDKKTHWNPHRNQPHLLPLLTAAMQELGKLPGLSTCALPPGPHSKANKLPITWVQGTHNPADGESRQPLIAAGLWKAPSEDC